MHGIEIVWIYYGFSGAIANVTVYGFHIFLPVLYRVMLQMFVSVSCFDYL